MESDDRIRALSRWGSVYFRLVVCSRSSRRGALRLYQKASALLASRGQPGCSEPAMRTAYETRVHEEVTTRARGVRAVKSERVFERSLLQGSSARRAARRTVRRTVRRTAMARATVWDAPAEGVVEEVGTQLSLL